MSNDATDPIRKSLRLLEEQHDVHPTWPEQIEQGWLQAQQSEFVDGDVAFDRLEARIRKHGRRLR